MKNEVHYHSLKAAFQALHPLSDEVVDKLLEKFHFCRFAKKELIVRPGDIADRLFYILKGVQRSYYFKEKEYTIYKRAEVLGLVTRETFTIGVGGTHGKTTTSCMVAYLLRFIFADR